MIKIVFLDAKTIGEVPNFRVLEKQGNLTIFEKTLPSEVLDRCIGQDVVITSKVLMSREILSHLPDLKLICVAATGMNNIDLEAAEKFNVQVKNVAGYSTESVAQLTFAMLLYLVNHLPYYDAWVKSGAYPKSDIFTHFGPAFWELSGKQLGIIGLGNIGRRVAQIAQSFGMEVVFFSTTGRNNNIRYKRFDLDTLLNTSDVVSIHAPLNDKTRGLIDYKKIHLMRPCAILLNTGRGGIIVENDLARALNENLIGGAGIDVMEQEPPSANNPLFKLQNKEKLLITPHIAWTSIEARQRLIENLALNIEEFQKSNGSI
jgi:lactate dehydrogenase-like 2-hydroxyacid dehydrogenase